MEANIYNIFQHALFIYFFWPCCVACGIFPRPGIEPVPRALGVWNLNHWTAREVLKYFESMYLLR